MIEKSNKLGKKGNYILQQMNFAAYQTIYQQHELYFKQQEENYGEKFYSFYKPLLNNSGETIGCINIPDINYKKSLKQDLSGFIATLININAFIFLLAAAIAFIVTNRITSSFTLIKNKMKAINWQSQNDEIEWNRNDEIGALVKEYNLMVRKLDETAKAFAQSQKEVAWKEMAKQVAHEIKNPLTPMKLSIQYLQNKIGEDAPNIKQLSATVANTLIEQINQLSNIASDFSQFANISNTKAEKVDMTEIVKSVVTLFSVHQNVSIEYNSLNTQHFVFADKIQITRLFTNLIKNAIEATNENTNTHIFIEEQIVNNYIIISLKDNGTGIPEELQPKIFALNFTTKNSGTGLGLAICKGIVENANGNIWFETGITGTTFFVELPLVENI
ncbi:MAG: HAMP domain-containing sensor histidine kinase [Bacteroidetes bacterium]|nr:HAMP domain-containing sensor histidine kinase [Bacteroidota bacterium]